MLGNKRLYIYGGFAGHEANIVERMQWRTYVTTLDGMGRGPVLSMEDNSHSQIDGFTITHGMGEGAGIRAVASCPTIANCIFTQNQGKAIFLLKGKYDGMSYFPGLMANADFYDNVTENKADSLDGIISVYDDTFTFYNVTMNNNRGTYRDVAISACTESTTLRMYNSVVYASGEVHSAVAGSPIGVFEIRSSLVEGCGGSGNWQLAHVTDEGDNLDADPLLADGHHLSYDSPCALSGNVSYMPNNLFAFYDLDGVPRIDVETFDPYTLVTSMGAYETLMPMPPTRMVETEADEVRIYPTLVQPGGVVTVVYADGGTAWAVVYTLTGQQCGATYLPNGNGQVIVPQAAGMYVLVVKGESGDVRSERIVVIK